VSVYIYMCVCGFFRCYIIYFQPCPITYAILHALFYLSHCLSSCEFNRLVLYISFFMFCTFAVSGRISQFFW
jgi:hypothetical protein